MEAEARYTWVGAAMLLLLAALVGALVWLKNVGGRNDYNRYTIHFEHQSLDGLQIGADVDLRGIKVGRVEDYALVDKGQNRVSVDIRVGRRAPVRTDTVAVVTRNLLTGIASISLVNADKPGAPLTEVPEDERYPVIAEGRSNYEELAGRVNQVGEIASTALSNLNQLLQSENRDALMATVRSLRQLAQGLNARLPAAEAALTQTGQAATAVAAAATRLGEAGGRIAEVAERGEQRLAGTLGEADRTLAEARQAVAQLNRSTERLEQQLTSTARRLETTAAGADDKLEATATELRLSIDAAARVLERLRDPRAALLGPANRQLGPGESLK
jgi:phospholipid/cholesterol/gamma-HCH transport system substrate-binding protein